MEKNNNSTQKQDNSKAIIYIISIIIAIVALISGFSGSSSKPKSSTVKGRPWEDLGTSQKEYMDAYKYVKSHSIKY